MGAAFNIFGRIVSTLLGLLIGSMGVIWILQAFNIAFNGPMGPAGHRSFMVGDQHWALYGVIAIAVGVLQIAWSNTRPSAGRA